MRCPNRDLITLGKTTIGLLQVPASLLNTVLQRPLYSRLFRLSRTKESPKQLSVPKGGHFYFTQPADFSRSIRQLYTRTPVL